MIDRLKNLLGIHTNVNLDTVVRQVTEECLAEVCQRVIGRTEGMNFSEARGYLRARAIQSCSPPHSDHHLRSLRKSDSTQMATIAHLATERLVPQVLRQARVGVPGDACDADAYSQAA